MVEKILLDEAESRHVRTFAEFAEDCIVIPPGGPYEGRYYSMELQPYSRLFFKVLDDSLRGTGQRFYRVASTGPTQTGKTLTCLTIPILYHQFELEEDTIYGVPTLEMAGDKWRRDILPVIQAGEFRRYMPTRGRGAHGGNAQFSGIDFTNGTSIKAMPAGGGDKQRAGYTARVLAATEIDGYKQRSESEEGSVIRQMEGRLRAYSVAQRRIYLECTVTVAEGAIWQEYINGSRSVILLPCPHCGEFVLLEREDFRGWQDAETDRIAMEKARFYCNKCGKPWEENQRKEANKKAILKHTNDSTTFSFRWSAVNNMFMSMADLAYDEWHSARRIDKDNAEREILQQVWATPYTPPPPPDYITIELLQQSVKGYMRGIIPDWAEVLTVGVDVGKWLHHWCAVAWAKDGTAHIIDYGRCECPSEELGPVAGIKAGLNAVHELTLNLGWQKKDGTVMQRDIGFVDTGWNPDEQSDLIISWCRNKKSNWWPAKGLGHSQGGFRARRMYIEPKGRSQTVLEIGDQWHTVALPNGNVIVQHNVDFGKLWVHGKLQQTGNEPGAMTLFTVSDYREHVAFLKHLTSEQLVEKDGEQKWIKESSSNHWLDALVLAAASARKQGVQVLPQPPEPQKTKLPQQEIMGPVLAPGAHRRIRTRY